MTGRLERYFKNNAKTASFGIKYLDDKLSGILKGDLILIGARSGAGKSSLADIVATHNSKQGKNVTLISLENFEDDNFVTKAYYKFKELTGNWSLSLRDFASGDFQDSVFNDLQKAEEYAENEYKNINLINRQKNYTVENLKEDIVRAVENQNSDLVILDHVDYLDKIDNESEITHITRIMKEIRNAQYAFKVPVIVISHLRKSGNSKFDTIIPGVDEFIGSSNKVKESTIVIMLAPDDTENIVLDKNLRPTWCCIRKLRMGGADNTAAKIYFNTKTGKYTDEYHLFKTNFSGSKVEQIGGF